jgi:hypothetical protein
MHRGRRLTPSSTNNTHKYLVVFIHETEPFLRNRQLCSYPRTSQHFMEPEVSLQCSQSLPLVPILIQIDPVQSIPSHLSKIHFFVIFRNKLIFYDEELAPRATPKLEDHPLSAVSCPQPSISGGRLYHRILYYI